MANSYLVFVNDGRCRVAKSELKDPAKVAEGILYGEISTKFLEHKPFQSDKFDFDKPHAFCMGDDPEDKNHANVVYGDGAGHTLKVYSVNETVNPFADI
jgi:hypothetical protein